MRIFAAIERILLDRWSKMKIALKINKWPLLNYREQQLQLKKQYLEDLLGKKWHKFEKPYIRRRRRRISPIRLLLYYSVWVSARIVSTMSLSATRTYSVLHCVTICWHLSLSPVLLSIRLRLTIMCDSNATCENAKISTQSQIGLL